MAGQESSLEKKVRAFAGKEGIYVRKTVSPSHAGFPDRMFAYGGTVLFLEFKRPGQRPTPLQAREIELLVARGICATWVDSYDKACELLRAMKFYSPSVLLDLCESNNHMERT